MDRPKRGFSVPLSEWLRGPLRDWASDLLAPARLNAEGLFDTPAVTRLWRRHLDGAAAGGHIRAEVLGDAQGRIQHVHDHFRHRTPRVAPRIVRLVVPVRRVRLERKLIRARLQDRSLQMPKIKLVIDEVFRQGV